jgi:hypothetical protein
VGQTVTSNHDWSVRARIQMPRQQAQRLHKCSSFRLEERGMNGVASELLELERAEAYTVAKDDVDPRGWSVVGCDSTTLGTVRTLLVDTELMRAVYFVCDLTPGHAVLLPIAYARLDQEQCRVIFDVIDAAVCAELPAYDGSLPTAQQRAAIDAVMMAGAASTRCEERRQSERRSE